MDEDFKKLISDYHRDKQFIARQKRKWLEPKRRKYAFKQTETKTAGEKKTR